MEIKTGRQVIDIEIKALSLLKSYISRDFVKVVNSLLKNKGKIIVSGIGKSGHIASKIASTLLTDVVQKLAKVVVPFLKHKSSVKDAIFFA